MPAGLHLAVVLTSRGVLRPGASDAVVRVARHIADYSLGTSFLSALVACALMTVMTWFVEGAAESLGVRIVMAWIVGSLLVLGSFNHAVVGTIELFYGLRFGGDIGWDQIATNLGTSIAGNLVGGLLLVTFARSAQALGASRAS